MPHFFSTKKPRGQELEVEMVAINSTFPVCESNQNSYETVIKKVLEVLSNEIFSLEVKQDPRWEKLVKVLLIQAPKLSRALDNHYDFLIQAKPLLQEISKLFDTIKPSSDQVLLCLYKASEKGFDRLYFKILEKYPQETTDELVRSFRYRANPLELTIGHAALTTDNKIILEHFIKHQKASPNICTKFCSLSLLHMAVMQEASECLNFLLSEDFALGPININSESINGTPLHIAASKGQLAYIKLLVEKGADINTESNGMSLDGPQTPANLAYNQKHKKCFEYLTEKMAEKNPWITLGNGTGLK